MLSAAAFEGAAGAAHQARVQDGELRGLSERGAGCDGEPILAPGQLDLLCQVELGGVAQAGGQVCIAIRWSDEELTGEESLRLSAGAVRDLHRRFAVERADGGDECGARLRSGLDSQVLGEATPDDVPRPRSRPARGAVQQSVSSTLKRPWGTRLRIRVSVAGVSGPSSGA